MANYLLVMGRGIEGCGNTRNAIELCNYINSLNDNHCEVISNKDVAVGRGWDQKNDITKLSFVTEYDEIKSYVDKADKIVITSVPPKKCDEKIKENFVDMLKYAHANGKHLTYFQFDHRIHSICRNMYFDPKYYDIFDCFDLVVTHSYDNDFSDKFLKKNNIKIKKFIARDKNINNFFSIDFDAVRNEVWKKFEDKEYRSLHFLGRSAAWKGPWQVRDFHRDYLQKDGWITRIEGIEMAINTLEHVFDNYVPGGKKVVRPDLHLIVFNKDDSKAWAEGTYKFERNTGAYVLPPYERIAGLTHMATAMFGTELVGLPDYISKDMIENTMFEIVASGTIPVFSKHWGDLFTINGKPLTSFKLSECGTLFLDENDPERTVKMMNALSENKEKYDKCREIAYNFYKNIFDNSVILPQLLGLINSK